MRSTPETTGRIWLITGAAAGFGRALAEAVLAEGDTVVATARQPWTLDGLATAHPGRVVATGLDPADQTRAAAVVDETVRAHGRIDVLVNNSGRGAVGAVEETADRELRELMEPHFFGPAALTRAVLPHMRTRRAGAIVQMSSVGGRFSVAGLGAYSAAKYALEGFSEALAQEVAPFGIKVLIVEPGAFDAGFAAGGVLPRQAPIAAYDAVLSPVMAAPPGGAGADGPAKAASAVLTALDDADTPLRLPLGADAADTISAGLDRARDELRLWEWLARDTGPSS
ncbi:MULTISPECIES: SDR family NAD(P)-dependent oxidoreductase [Thermomonosporaceae]|uniref:SDR family NAD(P)-dependent oxidoreductase n=1 Tax=Thermomonosporaceae TaxID=2012 RepID=UPI00255A719F|nr:MULTISPECIES: SDR family NAD(P)-dependent oxidoreductase [Thermomonosporaceae]MDL4774842.1 SDR family NAD(P)-dependent oxidoreductase [Actinomadura xylanilytica]